MTTTALITIVSLLIALSGASERLTEIIKGLIPFLNQENPDPTKEGWRRAAIQTLAVVSGIVTAWLSSPVIEPVIKSILGEGNQNWNASSAIFALGLLASFGAAFWNTILEYLLKVKNIKELTEENLKKLKNAVPPVPDQPPANG